MVEFFNESARRATYKKWIFKNESPCSADKMAEAGFIFIGNSRERDAVKCFFCEKPLDGWEETDDPWKEHLKHASNCEFAKIQKCQSDLTLEEWLNLKQKYEQDLIKKHYEDAVRRTKKKFENTRKFINKYY